MPIDRAALLDRARRQGPGAALEVTFNFIAPFVVYSLAEKPWGDLRALLASSAPPIIWSVIELVRHRRLDAISLLVLGGIALSLLAFIGSGNVRLLQLRENLVGGLIGLILLGSAAIGRPLFAVLIEAGAKRRSAEEAASLAAERHKAGFRRMMTVLTIVWGFGLLVATAIASALVFSLSIRAYLAASPFVHYGITGLLVLWTFLYARRVERRDAAATS